MQRFVVENKDGSLTMANWPIKENGLPSEGFEVSEDQLIAVQEGTHDFYISEGKLLLKDSKRKEEFDSIKLQEAQRKEEMSNLKKKLTEGKATLEEVQEALSKLI